MFSVNNANFLRVPTLKNICERLLLKYSEELFQRMWMAANWFCLSVLNLRKGNHWVLQKHSVKQ